MTGGGGHTHCVPLDHEESKAGDTQLGSDVGCMGGHLEPTLSLRLHLCQPREARWEGREGKEEATSTLEPPPPLSHLLPTSQALLELPLF